MEAALEELRELAHGIYPPLLADRGLAEALSAVAARAPRSARGSRRPRIGRYPPQVEATVYFCCLEALQNAGKHAGEAASATVRVLGEGGSPALRGLGRWRRASTRLARTPAPG